MSAEALHELAPPLGILVFFGGIAYIIKVVLEYRVRRVAIEKGVVGADLQGLFARPGPPGLGALRWGMIFIAAGIAAVVAQTIEERAFGPALFILVGVALIASYFIERRLMLQEKQKRPEGAGVSAS